MSTSETDEIPLGPCPCGHGKLVRWVTTQDNPWSTADIWHTLECSKCRGEWTIDSQGGLTNRASEQPANAAFEVERQAHDKLRSFAGVLVDSYFETFAAKSMVAEWREMQRLGISSMSLESFRKDARSGRPASGRAYPLRNLPWLSELAAAKGVSAELGDLSERLRIASMKTADMRKRVIRIPPPERRWP